MLITQSPLALAVTVTHIVLDRYRAAKYLVWARNLVRDEMNAYYRVLPLCDPGKLQPIRHTGDANA